MTRGLEWSAWGQTLALTFANSRIGGLRFSSITGDHKTAYPWEEGMGHW